MTLKLGIFALVAGALMAGIFVYLMATDKINL